MLPGSKSKLYKYGTKIASELRKQLVTITKRTLVISVAKIDTINVNFWGVGYFKIDFVFWVTFRQKMVSIRENI